MVAASDRGRRRRSLTCWEKKSAGWRDWPLTNGDERDARRLKRTPSLGVRSEERSVGYSLADLDELSLGFDSVGLLSAGLLSLPDLASAEAPCLYESLR